jgi:hypothetical protein
MNQKDIQDKQVVPVVSTAKFSRQLARKQWRKHCGNMFSFRGKLNSVPSFKSFIKGI